MHNHSEFCNAHYVKNADYIKFPFSASTVGPRVGAAALDMVGAALKVSKKSNYAMNFNSGVGFFDPQVLVDHTKELLCPLPADYWKDAPEAPSVVSNDELPSWAIVIIIVFCLLFLLFFFAAFGMYYREKQGKPLFVSLDVTSTTKATPDDQRQATGIKDGIKMDVP